MKTSSRHKIVEGLICKKCGATFSAREQRVKAGLGIFCSTKCASLWNAQQNGKKYVGKENGKSAFDKTKQSYYVYWFEPDTLKRKTTSYARWYWEVYRGEVPDKYRASYKDGNPLNIAPENIVLISPDEFGKAVSERLMGHTFSDETKKKMSEARIGKTLSDEHKKKIGRSVHNRWKSGEFETIHVGKNHRLWKGGVKSYPRKFSERLKLKIKRRDKFTCQSCGINTYGSRSGHVHHINGDKQNCLMSNLILLCSTCHNAVHNRCGLTNGKIEELKGYLK